MELKGKVIQLLPIQTGMGKKGQWKKQDFILETKGQYPKKVCLSLWGDKIDDADLSVGHEVSVSVELESREYNGRWYTEARAWKIGIDGIDATYSVPESQETKYDDGADSLPF